MKYVQKHFWREDLKLVSFLGANRTKSASVCPWLLNTIQYTDFFIILTMYY